jgi:tyrosyl-tRNA synthetase
VDPRAPVDLLPELEWRGLLYQVTDREGLSRLLASEPVTVYAGFDPTQPSLQVGNLLQLCTLRRFQHAGHRPIALMGGATGMIGDPGGKTEERALLSTDEIAANVAAVRRQLEPFLDLSDGRALLVDNAEWLARVGMLEFLREVGKHFTVNQMVAKESVRSRFESRDQGISYTEFSYMLLQAYDFLHLFDAYGCRVQLGGSDQWGNITMGVDLIRKLRDATAFGLTTPLVLNADGSKLGKTEAGTVWLDPARTSPYQLYQYFVRTDDRLVTTYLRYFTWLDHDRVRDLDRLTVDYPERREAQHALAKEVTALVHGDRNAARALRATRALFEGQLDELEEGLFREVFADAPSHAAARGRLDDAGVHVVDLAQESGLEPSKSAARRRVQERGLYVNNSPVDDVERRVTGADLLHDRWVVLRKGKHQYLVVEFRE